MQGRLKREENERQGRMEEKDRQGRMEEKDRQEKMEEKDRQERWNLISPSILIFPFQEADADKCFLHFEKVAGNLKWPTDYWVIQLQSVLVGKARNI